jgi:Flp pilus assembly protein TadD
MLVLMVWTVLGMGCATQATKAEKNLNSRKASSHVEIGGDHLANGRSALALREFRAAEKLDPDNATVHYGLGDAYLSRGKRKLAE